ncbi:MAG: UbiX family flavin prenyltransferase [Thermodesulfovibrionales bacterium]|nr:UbiX family flavin prenyltransferase [Thermodesulfovibrionales bacterium]
MKKFILAITGASGSIIGIKLLKELIKISEVHLIISTSALPIIKDETGIDPLTLSDTLIKTKQGKKQFFIYKDNDLWAPIASGSFKTNGMFIVPCSMKTLSAIANGYCNNLIERAADVTIKEKRQLLICPREMPLNAIHLENMLKLATLGVTIAPPVIAFYHRPKNIDDIINFFVGKILDSFNIDHNLFKRWGTEK